MKASAKKKLKNTLLTLVISGAALGGYGYTQYKDQFIGSYSVPNHSDSATSLAITAVNAGDLRAAANQDAGLQEALSTYIKVFESIRLPEGTTVSGPAGTILVNDDRTGKGSFGGETNADVGLMYTGGIGFSWDTLDQAGMAVISQWLGSTDKNVISEQIFGVQGATLRASMDYFHQSLYGMMLTGQPFSPPPPMEIVFLKNGTDQSQLDLNKEKWDSLLNRLTNEQLTEEDRYFVSQLMVIPYKANYKSISNQLEHQLNLEKSYKNNDSIENVQASIEAHKRELEASYKGSTGGAKRNRRGAKAEKITDTVDDILSEIDTIKGQYSLESDDKNRKKRKDRD
ncbi:hypothetical protein [Neptuniibacter sp. QD37_11]|uniref:hypothetical protein n=1 Tax=Neptuniibacter sp. QD37_11 TaxID=3398209 RepID=UPI0039F50763